MRISVFSTRPFERDVLQGAAAGRHELIFHRSRLDASTAVLADGCGAVCVFVNDSVDRTVIAQLAALGVRAIALRCSGYNNVDVRAASEHGLAVVNVPAYSPHAVAEHTLALLLTLNRKIHRAWNRVREGNFALDGLLGYDLNGRTAGVVGTGAIGGVTARTLACLGMRVLAVDPAPDAALADGVVEYVAMDDLLARSDVLSLHCPLTDETRHLIDAAALARMKPGVTLLNTGRGALIDTPAAIEALKSGHLGGLGIDVYEEEASLFFEDRSEEILVDDTFARLLTFPNVVVTAHQGFFTSDALSTIARTTVENLSEVEDGAEPRNRITWRPEAPGGAPAP
jgi:D-lactate dehydrogenase